MVIGRDTTWVCVSRRAGGLLARGTVPAARDRYRDACRSAAPGLRRPERTRSDVRSLRGQRLLVHRIHETRLRTRRGRAACGAWPTCDYAAAETDASPLGDAPACPGVDRRAAALSADV